MADQGRLRVAQGFSVVVFPEGTRKAPGQTAEFFIGGAWLACQLGVPVVPLAHNAGHCWPRSAIRKSAGWVDVRIGPAIDTAGRSAAEVNAEAKAWIDNACAELASNQGNP